MEKKIKVLHIAEAFGGGVYTMVKALTENTCEEFDVTLAFAWRPQTPPDFKEQMDPRVHLIELKSFQRSLSLKGDLKAYFETKRVVKEVDPDIIHLHSSKAGFLGRMAINCKKYKVLYTPHGYAFLKKDDSAAKRLMYKVVEWIAAKRGGLTVACSEGEYNLAKKITSRATYVNNGIEIRNLPEQTRTLNGKSAYKICTIGRIGPQKNPEMFNKIAAELSDTEFTWIGDGELREKLTSPNITITGWKEPKEAMGLLKQQDIFLLPSFWEGLSVALLESMYLKLVCVASAIPGTKEVLHYGENGFAVAEDAQYVPLLKDLMSGKYDLDKITENAHQDVIENYSIDVMCRKYAELYRERGRKSE